MTSCAVRSVLFIAVVRDVCLFGVWDVSFVVYVCMFASLFVILTLLFEGGFKCAIIQININTAFYPIPSPCLACWHLRSYIPFAAGRSIHLAINKLYVFRAVSDPWVLMARWRCA